MEYKSHLKQTKQAVYRDFFVPVVGCAFTWYSVQKIQKTKKLSFKDVILKIYVILIKNKKRISITHIYGRTINEQNPNSN